MFSGTDEPECPQRRRVILSHTVAAVTPVPLSACAADAPTREATRAVTHATIHAIALGAAPVGRAPLPAATQTGGETKGATDWANSIAVN
ncbi:hypothetical protein [Mycobacterium sp.]|jgi:hypothetical protein|uniref:hypothetical protein n=1 Tax=Mycobacterium sp. TaxID=1785 RepID=UPI002C32B523|nr:hypothetical protein [Mycobacterium sp.]HXB86637.1 hypothetical protein [Mycobacterium sp.]